jgi:MFS family permease
VGGMLGDRWGRPRAAMTALVCSGGTAVVLALSYPVLPITGVVLMCAFWGFWVIADSAQFSAMVTETADPDYIGGALSVQLALGFVVTMMTLWGVPQAVEHYSWRVALLILAVGPAIGVAAMAAAERRLASAARFDVPAALGTSQR